MNTLRTKPDPLADAGAWLDWLFDPRTQIGHPANVVGLQPEGADDPDPADLLHPTDLLPGHWWYVWEERAAIIEYDGGLHREQAEALALVDVMKQMRSAGARSRT